MPFQESFLERIVAVNWPAGDMLVIEVSETPGIMPFKLLATSFGSGGSRDIFTGPQPIQYGAPPFPSIVLPPSSMMLQRDLMWSYGLVVASAASRTWLIMNVGLLRRIYGKNSFVQCLLTTPEIGKSSNPLPYVLYWLWMADSPPYFPRSPNPFPGGSATPLAPPASPTGRYFEDFSSGASQKITTVSIWQDNSPLTGDWIANWYATKTFRPGDYGTVFDMETAMGIWSGDNFNQLQSLELHSITVPAGTNLGGTGSYRVAARLFSKNASAAQIAQGLAKPAAQVGVVSKGTYVAPATVTVTVSPKNVVTAVKS